MPHRLQQRRTHAVAHQQVLEGTQVDEFLRVHVLQGRRAGALAQHRKLAFVDTSGAVLPGVVDAQHAGKVRLGLDVAGKVAALRRCIWAVAAVLRCHGGSSWLRPSRSEEPTSELQSLMRISYAVFCLKKNNQEDT